MPENTVSIIPLTLEIMGTIPAFPWNNTRKTKSEDGADSGRAIGLNNIISRALSGISSLLAPKKGIFYKICYILNDRFYARKKASR